MGTPTDAAYPFAVDRNGTLTSENRDGPFRCIGCGRPVVFRRAHKRTRSSSGVTYCVRGHFAHAGTDSDGDACHETWFHAAAKALLVAFPTHPLRAVCAGCQTARPFDDVPTTGRRLAEFRFVAPGGGERIADVAVLADDDDGTLLGVIEVRHTHACDEAKLLDLCDALGTGWCEVSAVDVVECMRADLPIPILAHAAAGCETCADRRPAEPTAVRARSVQSRAEA